MVIASSRAHRLLLLLPLLLSPVSPSRGEDILISGKMQISIASQSLGHPPVTLDDRIWAMQFTPDGKDLLTVTDKIDRIGWPSKERRILWQPHDEETMTRATFSPDGTSFARSNNGDKVHVHETATGKLLHTFQGRDPRFTATAWSPDGSRLAVGADHEVVIYDIKTGKAAQRLSFGNSDITALAWSPDDRWIVAATEQAGEIGNSIFLHSLRGEAAPITLPGDRDIKFSFSPDSSILAVAGEVATAANSWREVLYFWDMATGKEIFRQQGHGYNCIVHSPDGKLLAACGLSELLILDARTGREISRQHGDSINSHIWSIAFSPNRMVIATGIEDRLRFRETTTWTEIDPDDSLRAPASAMAFSGDGKHLVTGGWNGDLVLWDWEEKTPVWKQLSPTKAWEIKALSVDPTARWIGVVQHPYPPERRGLRLVDFSTGETARFVDMPKPTDAAPLFHPARRTAYLASGDHDLVEWDCENGRVVRRLPVPFLRTTEAGRYGTISSLRFDPATLEVVHWAAETQAYGRLHLGSGAESHIFESRFIRPDSDPIPPRDHDFAAIGSFVWNLPSLHQATPGENLGREPSVRHPSDLLQFSASGRIVRVFDILSGSFIHAIHFDPGEIKAITLSPDGRTLVAAATGGIRYISLEGFPVPEGTPSDVLWRLMGGEDHWQAYQAAWALARQPDFIPFLESHLAPAVEPAPNEIARLKLLLADSNHEIRQVAARQWLDLGLELDRETYETLREGKLPEEWPCGIDPESLRALRGFDPTQPIPPLTPLSAHRRSMRAVMLLKDDRSEAGHRHLERLARGHATAPLTRAAARALASRR